MQNTTSEGKANTVKKLFSRETSVNIIIKAPKAKIWALLTDALKYPEWNSTVISIEGKIQQDETIMLKSKLDPKRVFKLKVKEVVPEEKLVWGDMMGSRVYTLVSEADGVRFTMSEKIGGPLFPLFSGMIPSFDESFEAFARDLKAAAEMKN